VPSLKTYRTATKLKKKASEIETTNKKIAIQLTMLATDKQFLQLLQLSNTYSITRIRQTFAGLPA